MFSNKVSAISHSKSDQPNPPQTTGSQSETRCEYCRQKWKKILLTSLTSALITTIGVIVIMIMAKKNSARPATTARPTTTTITATTTTVMRRTTTTIPMKGMHQIQFQSNPNPILELDLDITRFGFGFDQNCGAQNRSQKKVPKYFGTFPGTDSGHHNSGQMITYEIELRSLNDMNLVTTSLDRIAIIESNEFGRQIL
ncbi:unnamed protein product, partial [Adineta ricciae]